MERAFVDEVTIHVQGGDGGTGSHAFQREPYRPKGRPNGGDGGNGGSVILRVDTNTSTLGDLARHPHIRATPGRNGSSNEKHGARGEDKVILVPDGTEIHEGDVVIADLVGAGTEFIAAKGGRGGRGNASLATDKRRAPAFAERGERGQDRALKLELKVLADVGLVGLPSAGKSSLIATLSAARPKIADYPFTTLSPNLGVAETSDARFIIADVPGLIEGASEGRGLGLAFLRHLERCRILCFVLDTASHDEPRYAFDTLRSELRTHDESFDKRPGVIVANKVDIADAALIEQARAIATEVGFPFVETSATRGDGIERLSELLAEQVEQMREAKPERDVHRLIKIRPEEVTITVEWEDEHWRVQSAQAQLLLQRFDINNREAQFYIQEKLIGYGIEDALIAAGAKAGDEVRIGALTFHFDPEVAP